MGVGSRNPTPGRGRWLAAARAGCECGLRRWPGGAVMLGALARPGAGTWEERPCGVGSRSRPLRLIERGPEVQRDPCSSGSRASLSPEREEGCAGPRRPASLRKAALGSTVDLLGGGGRRWRPSSSAEKILIPAFACSLIPSFPQAQERPVSPCSPPPSFTCVPTPTPVIPGTLYVHTSHLHQLLPRGPQM